LRQSAFACLFFTAAVATTAPALSQEIKPFQGLYVGVHGGYGWQNITGVFDNGDAATSLDPLDNNGPIAGGQLGYNVQHNWFMMGVEADASGSLGGNEVTHNEGLPAVAAATLGAAPQTPTRALLSADLSYLATIRGRLGFVMQNVLFYGTAGVAFGRFKLQQNLPDYNAALRLNQTVGVYGGGIEWKLAYGVSIRGEYLHYDFGRSSSIPDTFYNTDSGDVVSFHDINVARAGLNISLGQ
jgi:outer membrane immunogenic protein